jgi:hypothetical protein
MCNNLYKWLEKGCSYLNTSSDPYYLMLIYHKKAIKIYAMRKLTVQVSKKIDVKMDVSTIKICLDISVLVSSNMNRREYVYCVIKWARIPWKNDQGAGVSKIP